MRILIVHNRYQQRGGEDVVFESEVELLKSKGQEVETLVFSNDEIDGLFSKLKTAFGLFYNFKSARLMKEKIISFRPDLIHVHNFFPIASPSILIQARIRKIPLVMTLHNYRLVCSNAMLFREGKVCELCVKKKFAFPSLQYRCYRNSFFETLLLAMMVSVHKLIGTFSASTVFYVALTRFAKNIFLNSSLSVKEDHFFQKSNFSQDHGFQIENRKDHFLFVGRLSQEKGIEALLNAATASQVHLKIIGDGPFKERVLERAATNKKIEYMGFCDRQRIISEMKECKALVFPSLWVEGMPMTVLEAFSTGTPVIASRLGAMSELIEDGENGFLVEPYSENALAEILAKNSRESIPKEMYEAARRSYEQKFSVDQNAETLLAIYNSLLK